MGVFREINVSPVTHGEWHEINVGSIWLLEIHAPSASGIIVLFDNVYLPLGAEIYVYSPANPDKYDGPHRGGPELNIGPILDDRVVIELLIPKRHDRRSYDRVKPPFFIKGISHIYRTIRRDSTSDESVIIATAGSCHNDATCFPDWANERDSVGRLVYVKQGTAYGCTGTMLKSLANDYSPYFLTANHCIADSNVAETARVYWFYETPSCNGPAPVMRDMPMSSDSFFVAGSADTDFTLLEILGTVPGNLTWAGWTTQEPDLGDSMIGIHHPGDSNDHKRISFGNIAGSSTNFWDVQWCSGTTEGGSSGSCIWNSSHECIGQDSYGTGVVCDPNKQTHYGKFSLSYPFIQNFLQSGSDDTADNNHSRLSAKLISQGTYKSNVVKLDAEDWYKVTVPSNTRIAVDLSYLHNNGNINIELYRDSDQNPVSTSTGTGNSEHVEHFNADIQTDYFFRVFLADDTRNTYNMTVGLGDDPAARWIKGFYVMGEANTVAPSSDNGYVMAGSYLDGSLWVLKFDAVGEIQWQKTFGGSYYGDAAYSVEQTADGGYIVAGEKDTNDAGNYDAWVLKLDGGGNAQWQKSYGSSLYESANSVRQTSDGGYIMAGEKEAGSEFLDAWLMKLDANGNVLWQKTYGGSDHDSATAIELTSDGGYIMAGETKSFGWGMHDFWVLKLDSSGNVLWQKASGGLEQDVAWDVQQTADGGYIVAGETYSFVSGDSIAAFWVLKLDPTGTIQWQKSYSLGDAALAYTIRQTTDGGYVVGGRTTLPPSSNRDGLMMKLDSSGSILWQHTYAGSDYWDYDSISSIRLIPDGGFIAAGYIDSGPSVLRLDSDGTINDCSFLGTPNVMVSNTSATVVNTSTAGVATSISPVATSSSGINTSLTPVSFCEAIPSKPDIFIYPSSLNFSYVNVAAPSTRRLRVRNMGNADLSTNSITIGGTDAGDFSQINTCSTVMPDSSCFIDVTFAPSSSSAKSATLSVSSNDPNAATVDIALNVTGGYLLTVAKSGSGTVSSSDGLNCGNVCSRTYSGGSSVTLTASPDVGAAFGGWTGCDSATGDICTITIGSARTVTALFVSTPIQYALTVLKSGETDGGSVTSCPVGIDCGSDCSGLYDSDKIVVLTITPNDGYHISSVTGCGGTLVNSTYVTAPMTQDCTVTASFAKSTYTVTPSAGTGGSISPNTPQTMNYYEIVSFTVTPNSGNSIASVSGCRGTLSGNTYTTGPITADCTVAATFAPDTYLLGITKNGTGSGTVTSAPAGINCGEGCSAMYDYGTSVTLTASANAGSIFAGWSGGGCSGTGSCTVSMDADKTVTATFTQYIAGTSPNGGENWTAGSTYQITWTYTGNPGPYVKIELYKGEDLNRLISDSTSIGSNGSGSKPWAVPAAQTPGTDYKIKITSTSNSAYSDMSDSNFTISPPTITVTSPNGGESWTAGSAYSITWTYTGKPGTSVRIELYKGGAPNRLIYSSTSIGSNGSGSFNWGIPQNQTAGSDYTVKLTTNNGYTDTSDGDFWIGMYRVTPTAGSGGSISPSSPQPVAYNATTSFTISPDTGFHIASVTGCEGALSGNTYTTGPITADCTVTASFAINTYTITASAGATGTISPSGTITVNHGSDSTFAISPNTGYHVADVLVDGSSMGAITTYTFSNITAAHTIDATFAINTYSLGVSKYFTGSGTVTSSPAGINCGSDCAATYNYNTAVALSATSSEDSIFMGWSGDADCADGTVTMNADKTCVASFSTCATCHSESPPISLSTMNHPSGLADTPATCQTCHTPYHEPVDTSSACGQCHTSGPGPFFTTEQLTVFASNMHSTRPVARFTASNDYSTSYKVDFDASSSTCESGNCAYTWTSTGSPGGLTPGITSFAQYSDSTSQVVTLTVTDSTYGASNSISKTVYPTANKPPTVGHGTVSYSADRKTVTFTDTSSDDIPSTATVYVNWGDGSPLSSGAIGGTFSHTYGTASTFTVNHKVTDAEGLYAKESFTVDTR